VGTFTKVKTIYLLRHAKSSWDNPGLDDFDRPVNNRGLRDAPRMGKRLRKSGIKPLLIISSPAARAIATARLAAEEMQYPPERIKQDKKLYHAGGDTFLAYIQSLDDSLDHVMLVGHNPGLTEFANDLLNADIGNIPTAGFVCGKLKIESWKEANWGCGKLETFDYPKKEGQ
jgi:phosphohistidine phosphatase